MRKLSLLVLFSLSVTLYSSAQKEVSTATYYHKGVRWISGVYYSVMDLRGLQYYEIKEDSIIGKFHYNKIYCNNNLIALVRNDDGDIYFRLLKNEKEVPRELWEPAYHGPWHEDYLLYSFKAEKWHTDSVICYNFPYYHDYSVWTETFNDTIKEGLLDTVQLDNGKYHKRYKTTEFGGFIEDWYIIFGFGDDRKGLLGCLIPEPVHEVKYRLIELYDNDELVFRSKDYLILDISETVEDGQNTKVFYSPTDKLLQLSTSLPEDSYTVELFRMDGVKVLSFSGTDCSLAGIPPGIYSVRVLTGDACIYKDKIRVE